MGCPKLGWTIVFEWDGALPQRTDSQTMAMLHALNYSHRHSRSVAAGRSAGGFENELFDIYLIDRGHSHSKK